MKRTTIVRMITVAGMLIGIFCIGATSIILGSLSGTALGCVADVAGNLGKAKEAHEIKAHI